MNFTQLKAFFSVAKHRSFTLACKELNVSQPTISLHVQKLEKECSNPLLIRKGKQISLTDEGQLLYSYAEKIFAIVDEMEKAVKESNILRVGELKIGATFQTVKDLVPKITYNLKHRYPNINIKLFTRSTREVLEKVVNFEYHVGIVARMSYPDNVVYKHIGKRKLYLITADKAMRKKIHLKDLANYPIILPMAGAAYREIVINEFKNRNIPLNIFVEAADPTTVKSMVNRGLGSAFLDLDTIEQDAKDGMFRIVDILDDLHFHFDIIYLSERRRSNAVRSILSAINEVNWEDAH